MRRKKTKTFCVFSNFTLVEGYSLGKDNALDLDNIFNYK